MQNKECEYFPCHNIDNLQCDFCYCPLYPCYDKRVRGKIIKNDKGEDIWDCKDCVILHKKQNVNLIIEMIKTIKQREARNAIQS